MNSNLVADQLIRLSRYMALVVAFLVVVGSVLTSAKGQQANTTLQEANMSDFAPQSTTSPQVQPASKTRTAVPARAAKFDLTGRFHLVEGTNQGVLILKAAIPEGQYIYALTQQGTPPPSQVKVTESTQFQIGNVGFSSDRNPKVIKNDPVFKSRLEKHTKDVQFFVPIQIAAGVDPSKVVPEIVFNGQVCSDSGTCMPIRNRKIKANFAGYYKKQAEKTSAAQNVRR